MNNILKNKLDTSLLQQRAYPREKDKDDPRGFYFRDATAIMHCTAFRRLKHKTQVFFAPSNDHVCTRLEHVLHVSSIAVTICKALELDTDLAWAIGLGHDLGHTPFGHLGEKILSKLTGRNFCHELHSLRVVDLLADLNLTHAVRDGIVTHCGEKFEQEISPSHKIQDLSTYKDRSYYSATYEGSIVRMADKIAYLGRDFEDAVILGILNREDLPLPLTHTFGSEHNTDIINSFARDLIGYAQKNGKIGFSDTMHEVLLELKDFNYKNIYLSPLLINQGKKFERLLEIVYEQLASAIHTYKDDFELYEHSEYFLVKRLKAHLAHFSFLYDLNNEESRTTALIDYIAGMTDDYVISSVKNSLFPTIEISKL